MKKISVSLLVFNEKHNLEKTISKAYEELEKTSLEFELWIVDNHSDDGTDVLLNSLLKKYKNLRYYQQKKNFGYSVNFQTALKLSISDYKFVIDGDGQYDLEDVKKCIEILDSGYDILIGIRKPRKDPKIRIVMTLVLKFLSKIILGSNLKDINVGFRCMTKEAANKIILHSSKCDHSHLEAKIIALLGRNMIAALYSFILAIRPIGIRLCNFSKKSSGWFVYTPPGHKLFTLILL